MPKSPRTLFTETNLSHGVAEIPTAIRGVMLTTLRGPLGLGNEVITSWPQFERIYGGLAIGYPGVTLAKRALERGAALRVYKLTHYVDLTDSQSWDATHSLMSDQHQITLAGALGAGHAIVATHGVDVVTSPFATSSIKTLENFAALLKAETWIAEAIVVDGTHINVATKDGTAVVFSTTGAGAPVITDDTYGTIVNAAGDSLFGFTPKNPGADGDNVVVLVRAGSNSRADSFDVVIQHLLEPSLTEEYPNIRISGKPTAPQSDYLLRIATDSRLVTPVYYDLSAIAGAYVVPLADQALGFEGGVDGSALVAGDYIGDSAGKTGLTAFDGIDDVSALAILDDVSALAGIHEAGAAYANNRKDLCYFFHLGAEGDTEQDIATERLALNIDTSYARGFCGGIIHVNTLTSQEEWISELGDVLGISAYSEEHFGPWLSFAGKNRGEIFNAIGSGNNWGARGNTINLDILGNAQMNPVIDRDRKAYLLSNYTMAVEYSQLSFGEIRDLVIYLKKSLAPTAERYLEEPCDPISWRKLYLEVRPFLDNLEAQRAFQKNGYRWEGDQFARSVNQEDLRVNDAANIALGKYKVRLFIQAVVGMKEIAIDIVITPSSVSFEDALALVQP